jgi:hypothetical protein
MNHQQTLQAAALAYGCHEGTTVTVDHCGDGDVWVTITAPNGQKLQGITTLTYNFDIDSRNLLTLLYQLLDA